VALGSSHERFQPPLGLTTKLVNSGDDRGLSDIQIVKASQRYIFFVKTFGFLAKSMKHFFACKILSTKAMITCTLEVVHISFSIPEQVDVLLLKTRRHACSTLWQIINNFVISN